MGEEVKVFVLPEKADLYANEIDCNPVHRGVKNGLLPEGCVSGLYLIELINKALWLPNILCSTDFSIRWLKPIMMNDELIVKSRLNFRNQRRGVMNRDFIVWRDDNVVAKGYISQRVLID